MFLQSQLSDAVSDAVKRQGLPKSQIVLSAVVSLMKLTPKCYVLGTCARSKPIYLSRDNPLFSVSIEDGSAFITGKYVDLKKVGLL